MSFQIKSHIIEHEEVAPHTRLLVLGAPKLAQSAQPGQFVHVLCGSSYDPLLRRPLGVHAADPKTGHVSLLYEIVGRGTSLLAEKCKGEILDVLGPLGNGFALPKSKERPVLLIAGGIGIAPIYFLAQRIKNAAIIIGARTKDMLLYTDQFADVRTATDDGSAGYHGFVTGPLQEYIKGMDKSNPPLVYACGPMPMLKAVAGITKAHGLKCQISTEAKMACGVGACMSCVIKVKSGDSYEYVRACKEGPVFDAYEVIWE